MLAVTVMDGISSIQLIEMIPYSYIRMSRSLHRSGDQLLDLKSHPQGRDTSLLLHDVVGPFLSPLRRTAKELQEVDEGPQKGVQ